MWNSTVLSCLVLVLYLGVACCLTNIYLSGNLIPKHYDLMYTFDLDPNSKFAYVGLVAIHFTVKTKIEKIILHADTTYNIVENKVILSADGSDVPAIMEIEMSEMYDFMIISLIGKLVPTGNYTLTIPFAGNLHEEPYGLFYTSYVEVDAKLQEKTRYMVLSNFKPAEAHRAFPCFDEPKYKATFTIVIGHHIELKAISNMKIVNSTNINPLQQFWPLGLLAERFKTRKEVFAWDQFGVTPPISTYLVAIVLTRMVSMVQTTIKETQVEFKMWSRSEITKSQLSSGATLIQRIALSHSNILKMKFPLPKLDVIAMPSLSVHCYDHWGLLVCHEDIVLHYNKGTYVEDIKELALTELSLRLATQWFGGLVTCSRWQDAWLNEGLARTMVPLVIETIDRDDNFEINYVVQHLLRFLHSDSIRSALPLNITVDDPRDIFDAMNTELNTKAYLVMNMVFKLIHYETYTMAMNGYLREFSYSVADFESFCTVFASYVQYSKLPSLATLREMLEPWVRHQGYPLLKAYRDVFSDNALKLSQQYYVTPMYEDSAIAVAWWIPFSVITKENLPIEHYWLPVDDTQPTQPYVIQKTANVSGWVVVNSNSMTPMRVAYDEKNWVTLIHILTVGPIQVVPTAARAQIVSDAFALAWSEHIDYNIPINLANYLAFETEWAPFYAAFIALERIENALTGSVDYIVFEKYVSKLIENIYNPGMKLKRSTDLFNDKLQAAGVRWACKIKVPDCEQTAITYFDRWMEGADPEINLIPPAIRPIVYRVAMSRGGQLQWQFAAERVNTSARAHERRHLLLAMMHVTDLPQLKTALEWTVSDQLPLTAHDRMSMLLEALSPPYSYPVARELIYTRTGEVLKRCSENIGELMKTLTRRFTTQQELTEFNSWSEKYVVDLEKHRLAIRQGADYAKGNINWMSNHQHRVIELMRKYAPATESLNTISRRHDLKSIFSIESNKTPFRSRGNSYCSNYLNVLLSLVICYV